MFLIIKKNDMNVLDLYSGMGGFGTGFENYFNISDAIDIWDVACETYKANHKNTKVKNIEVSKFIDYVIPKDYEGISFSGIIGGPPCQDFSVLNQKRDSNSKRANEVFVFLELIKIVHPKFVVIENVASIPAQIKLKVIKILQQLNYKVISKVVLASKFGSIQKRRRWILTACLDKFVYPQEKIYNRQAKEILTEETISEYNMSEKIFQDLLNVPKSDYGKWIALENQKYKAYFIIKPEGLLPSIPNLSKLRIVHPSLKRYLTIKEIKRSQGFDFEYIMKGTKTQQAQLLANAIPVELSSSIAEAFAQVY